jgi:hypothetical protein
VYAAVLTADCVRPDAVAIAFTVSVELTVIGLLYTLDEVVGAVPLVV